MTTFIKQYWPLVGIGALVLTGIGHNGRPWVDYTLSCALVLVFVQVWATEKTLTAQTARLVAKTAYPDRLLLDGLRTMAGESSLDPALAIYRSSVPQDLQDAVEALKLEYLSRGYVRGQTAPRAGTPFCLRLVRADEEDAARRHAQAGIPDIAGPGEHYYWWGTVDLEGKEVPLGSAGRITCLGALDAYKAILDPAVWDLIGYTPDPLGDHAFVPAPGTVDRCMLCGKIRDWGEHTNLVPRAPNPRTPHQFLGRADRVCTVCGLPDRDSIHTLVSRRNT